MGLGVSLFLIAVGAILTWAVDAQVTGLDVTAVGVILMVVGLVGGLFSLAFWSSWRGPGWAGRSRLPEGRRPFGGVGSRRRARSSKSRPPRSKNSSRKAQTRQPNAPTRTRGRLPGAAPHRLARSDRRIVDGLEPFECLASRADSERRRAFLTCVRTVWTERTSSSAIWRVSSPSA